MSDVRLVLLTSSGKRGDATLAHASGIGVPHQAGARVVDIAVGTVIASRRAAEQADALTAMGSDEPQHLAA